MNKRPDLQLITELVSAKKMTLKDGMAWMKLPYFDIPMQNSQTAISSGFAAFVNKERTSGEHRKESILTLFLEGDFYFSEFIMNLDGDIAKIKGCEDRKTVDFTVIPDKQYVRKLDPTEYRLEMVEHVETGTTKVELSTDSGWLSDKLVDVGGYELGQQLVTFALVSLMHCIYFRDYNNQQDKYMIRVSPERKPKIKGLASAKEQLRMAAGPRIIYLDKLPSSGGSDGGVEGQGGTREMTPHQRRGTWVTLRAERYRYHPKYQVEKGVYRKPAWVGPKEAVVEGNIYTILE